MVRIVEADGSQAYVDPGEIQAVVIPNQSDDPFDSSVRAELWFKNSQDAMELTFSSVAHRTRELAGLGLGLGGENGGASGEVPVADVVRGRGRQRRAP